MVQASGYIELLELQQTLRSCLEKGCPDRIWVRAEIASIRAKANGHCYLELSQSDGSGVVAKARAVIWRNRYAMLAAYFAEATGSPLGAGMTVLLMVQVSYSEVYGLTLVVEEIDAQFTLGEAELAKRRTISRLEADGMMNLQKTLEPSPLPYRLAVISAGDAAGYGDFVRHLQENEYGFAYEVDLFEALMQGDGAPESVADALDRIQTSGTGYDAVLIIRGGGSVLDLACFDDYGMCFAIAGCPIPVYTAIGHDRDFHVADMVAYAYVKTPTALADLFVDASAAEDERIGAYGTRLRMAFASKISSMESALAVLQSRIHSADPRVLLSRGYSLVTDRKGVVLKSGRGLGSGDRVRIMFGDGTVEAVVE
ncbi:MAG: exodeoxyribonuclease VII large subunit [Bacteroidales bacterium]|nr:exodeoxyribonuclease VII large subunit [Bacteroidales bacterium]